MRQAEVESFLRDVKPWLKFDVVPIYDVYGPTAWDDKLEGLIVSAETAKGGDLINVEREKKVRERVRERVGVRGGIVVSRG